VTGWPARYVQYAWVLIITFGWHIFVPFMVLRYVDKLTLRESCAFLGLNRVDWRGLLTVLPIFMVGFAVISLPYVKCVAPVIEDWTKTIPLFRIPSYSIFQDTPENIYSFPPIALLLLGIGNFLGEELYFRGYLMKKSAFLGEANWTVNSLLFGLYHVWQAQQTWPMLGLILTFGLFCEYVDGVRHLVKRRYRRCLVSSIKVEVKKKHISLGWNFACFAAHVIEQDLL
jgi:membrane protease YdiL (CAAX protease family)